MDLLRSNYKEDSLDDASSEQSLPLDSFDPYDVFGEPFVLPRVGDQYQVEIPLLISEAEYLSYTKNPSETEITASLPRSFLMGLPVSVVWISDKVENMAYEREELVDDSSDQSYRDRLLQSNGTREVKISLKEEDSKVKVEPTNITPDNGIRPRESPDLVLEQEMKSGMHQKYRGPGDCLVPGSYGDSWSDVEEACFLLGLYIFGKNLVQVKRLMESKSMGDILSFYYGKFYKSDGYCRWSECRKLRSRRSVIGSRIFTGMRLQELLSRLLPHVSGESHNTLSEVFKTFEGGKISLEEFVLTMKSIVGMDRFVEAVSIGKGKRDLTGIGGESMKSNHVSSARPEIPTGKACSSLTPMEIMKFLTGDFRLSKARSNDLFWEAVWPRLLARGWHSEEPRYQRYIAGSKHSLVFLTPGVKKFSRRRLVKGKHYFDSVTDVLNQVASDPALLEFEVEAYDGNTSREEIGWASEAKFEQDNSSDRQNHCYLQPRTPVSNVELMKFTVVDTSLADGKVFKLRELRTLPVEASEKITSASPSVESEVDASEVSTDESDSASTMLSDLKDNKKSVNTLSDLQASHGGEDLQISASDQEIPTSGSDFSTLPFKDHNNLCENKALKKTAKSSSKRRPKDDKTYLAPIAKRRRRLTACTRAETSHGGNTSFSMSQRMEDEKRSCCSDTPESSANNLSLMDFSQKRLSSTNISKDSFVDSNGGTICDTNSEGEEKSQSRALIDLNLPHCPPDIETGDGCMAELKEEEDDRRSKQRDDPIVVGTSTDMVDSEQQLNMNSRRQSTRNRPPTARALEALANGYLTVNRRRKSKETGPGRKSKSRSSQNDRFEVGVAEKYGTETMNSKVEESENGACNGNSDTFIRFQSLSEVNGTKDSGP